jgi:hypothetical protein
MGRQQRSDRDPLARLRDQDARDPVRSEVRRATRLLIGAFRELGAGPAQTRRLVTAAVEDAFRGPGIIATETVAGGRGQLIVPIAGFYLLILQESGLDRSDLQLQEAWLSIAQRVLDEELPAGGAPG